MRLEGRISEIYDAFKDYYGEAKLDINRYNPSDFNYVTDGSIDLSTFSGWFIMVHWPEVEVSNEKDEKVTIWGLYGMIFINENGRLQCKPLFNRSTYNLEQYTSGYVHSHLHTRRLCDERRRNRFEVPCLGNGPIVSTIGKLRDSDVSDINIWRLFCWELDKVVHVESLTGGPYMRMSYINGRVGENKVALDAYYMSLSKTQADFLVELYKIVINSEILTFAYVDNQYFANVDCTKTIMKISDCFIKEYNRNEELRKKFPIERLKRNFIINKAYLYNGNIYMNIERLVNVNNLDTHVTLFKFKGNDVKFEVISATGECNTVTIIQPAILTKLIYNIQKFVNIYYGREEAAAEENGKII